MGTGFDAWYPGYIDYKPVFQNIASYWTETALYSYATPRFYTMNDFPQNMRDLRPQALYTSPWPGGWWRLRDAVEYMETASLSVLDYAARYRESVLLNRYRAGRSQIEKYTKAPPYAYFIPQQQRDPAAAVEMLRRLAFQGIRVSQLSAPVTTEGVTYAIGTWVVPMDQAFAETVRQVMDVQRYPDLRESPDGPLEQPYDAAGWTLPLQMGVSVTALTTPMSDELRGKLKALGADSPANGAATPYEPGSTDVAPFDTAPGVGFDTNSTAAAIVPPAGKVTGTGSALAVDPAQNNTFAVLNRAWLMGARVFYTGVPGAPGASGASGAGAVAASRRGDGPHAGAAGRAGEIVRAAGRTCRRPQGSARAEAPARGALPAVDGQHGRGLDALDARALWLRRGEPLPARLPRGRARGSCRHGDHRGRGARAPRGLCEGRGAAAVRGRHRR
jgi:hypothetical protein